jgi:hypothetical protein
MRRAYERAVISALQPLSIYQDTILKVGIAIAVVVIAIKF